MTYGKAGYWADQESLSLVNWMQFLDSINKPLRSKSFNKRLTTSLAVPKSWAMA
jgi:hypothetical protein